MKLSRELEEFFASSEPLTDEEYQSLIDASAELSKDPQYVSEVAAAIEQHRIVTIVYKMAEEFPINGVWNDLICRIERTKT